MAKKITILVRSCPYGMATSAEAFRGVVGLAGMDHKVKVVFVDDGIYSLKKDQHPEIIEMKDISKGYATIGDFDAENYILEEDMKERNLSPDDFALGNIINKDELKKIIDDSDVVMSFS
ncbi:hypothetical protein DRQ26_01720 [bacterium]|nr:MAG: hypothetical protein DRQ26_01720 [bacterium]